jgi:glycosyltransferase involved in cell wall biosynthesis
MKVYLDGIIYSLQKNGGVTRYTDELADKIVALGNKVTFFMHPSILNEPPKKEGIDFIQIKSPLNTRSKIIKYLTYPIDKFLTSKYFKTHQIDKGIFHTSYFSYYKDMKIPQIVTVHDLIHEKFPEHFNYITNKIFLHQKRKAIVSASAIICVSQQTSKDLCELYNVDLNKINVVHLGVDEVFNQKKPEEKASFTLSKNISKPYYLFVGKRSLYKNFDRLVKAFANWDKKNEFFIISIGGGKFTSKEMGLITSLGLKDDILIFDFVTEKDLILFYNCAKAFIFPSSYEGFGMPIIEAMACGTPVLASDIPVFREIGHDTITYFNPDSEIDITKALDSTLYEDLIKINTGIELAKKFTWEKTASETINVYKKYIN